MENKVEKWALSPNSEGKTTIDEAKFVLSQSEKLLKETISNSDLIVSRTVTLTTLVVGLMVALLGYSIKKWDDVQEFDSMTITAIAGIAYLMFIGVILYLNLKGRGYHHIGSQPKILYAETFFGAYYDGKEKERERDFYLAEIYSYQKGITHNMTTNERRWKRLNTSIGCIIAFPIILGIIYLLLTNLQVCYYPF